MHNNRDLYPVAILALLLVFVLFLSPAWGPVLVNMTRPDISSKEAEAFNIFSAACQKMGPLDHREDSCRLIKGADDPECVELTTQEKILRGEYQRAIDLREEAKTLLPWWAQIGFTYPVKYDCSERELSGTPHRRFHL